MLNTIVVFITFRAKYVVTSVVPARNQKKLTGTYSNGDVTFLNRPVTNSGHDKAMFDSWLVLLPSYNFTPSTSGNNLALLDDPGAQ